MKRRLFLQLAAAATAFGLDAKAGEATRAKQGFKVEAQKDQALATPPKLVAYTFPHRDSGFNFVDFLGREAKTDGVDNLTADSYTVHSTINAQLQRISVLCMRSTSNGSSAM